MSTKVSIVILESYDFISLYTASSFFDFNFVIANFQVAAGISSTSTFKLSLLFTVVINQSLTAFFKSSPNFSLSLIVILFKALYTDAFNTVGLSLIFSACFNDIPNASLFPSCVVAISTISDELKSLTPYLFIDGSSAISL